MILFPAPLSEVLQGDIFFLVQHGKNLATARCVAEDDGVVRAVFNGGYSWLKAEDYGKSWECFR